MPFTCYSSHSLSGLPVIDENWELVGYLSESDILKPTIPTYLEILAQSSFFGEEENLLFQRFGGHEGTTWSKISCTKTRCSSRRRQI